LSRFLSKQLADVNLGANVLITEDGGVQLCDFGVAGTLDTKLDKRSTRIGTPHWMAPELFDPNPSYGKEVDIWAFGSMAYEIATGYPPNALTVRFDQLGSHLKQHVPRLEDGDYSEGLRSIVAYCLEEKPSERPAIENVQKHNYINGTHARYPTSSLAELVKAFRLWEDRGGSRKSLWMPGGAQGPSELSSTAMNEDDWNFSTTAAFEEDVMRNAVPSDIVDVYGLSALNSDFLEETKKPPRQKGNRRRPPPEVLKPLKAPLEKIFDPNTMSSYEYNSRAQYGNRYPPPSSDLPLRDDSAQDSIRDTMIDLGGHDAETGMSSFPDLETIRADRTSVQDETYDYGSGHDFNRPPLSDPADAKDNRRTQDWKFPSMAPPMSADPEVSRFSNTYEPRRPSITPGSGNRPALIHHPTEPVSIPTAMASAPSSPNRMSLIDLDLGLPDPVEPPRPSTAIPDMGPVNTDSFPLERYPSLYLDVGPDFGSEPVQLPGPPIQEPYDYSASESEDVGSIASDNHGRNYSGSTAVTRNSVAQFPTLPPPPSVAALSGTASHQEMADEMLRMLGGLTDQLSVFKTTYENLPPNGRRR
jgi:hypothetical protein